MKRTLALLLVVVSLTVMLVSCGGNSIEGTWTATEEGVTMTMTFEDDGTGSMSTLGMTYDITWSTDGDKLTVSMSVMGMTQEVFTDAEYAVDGDELTITVAGESTVFTKE